MRFRWYSREVNEGGRRWNVASSGPRRGRHWSGDRGSLGEARRSLGSVAPLKMGGTAGRSHRGVPLIHPRTDREQPDLTIMELR